MWPQILNDKEPGETISEMESEGGLTSNGNKAPSIAEGIEQLCLGEELEAVVASRLGDRAFDDHDELLVMMVRIMMTMIMNSVLWWSSLLWSLTFLGGGAIIVMRMIRMR